MFFILSFSEWANHGGGGGEDGFKRRVRRLHCESSIVSTFALIRLPYPTPPVTRQLLNRKLACAQAGVCLPGHLR